VLARAAKAVGGGAGGKGDLASAGGRDPSRLEEALRIARADALELLGGSVGRKGRASERQGGDKGAMG
jgi:alanyl-tRNA synthetase